MALGNAALCTSPILLSENLNQIRNSQMISGNDTKTIRIGVIGCGGMGLADGATSLTVPNVKIVAACDLYDKRLEKAREKWGESIFTTKDYNEILAMPDVDAVIIATCDHWHQPISIAAMQAGKHVYCEKPIIHKINEIEPLKKAAQKSNVLFQIGSQGMASIGNRKAKFLIESGAIGKLNCVEGQFSAPPYQLTPFTFAKDASEKTIWWERFLGNAPKRPFELQRFFIWRNWEDYGTGIAGDLFVHVFASLHYITGALGPEKIYTTGGINYHTNGSRDVADIMIGSYNYPDVNGRGAFIANMSGNFEDGVSKKWGSANFKVIGSKGTLDVCWDSVTLKTFRPVDMEALKSVPSVGFGIDEPEEINEKEVVFKAKEDYGGHYYHWENFINAIRSGKPVTADLMFGLRASAPAVLSCMSYKSGKPVYWNPEKLKITRKS